MTKQHKWAMDNIDLLLSDKTDEELQKLLPTKRNGKLRTVADISRRRREIKQAVREGAIKTRNSNKPIRSFKTVAKKTPRILIYDIETSYIITKEKKWRLYDENPIDREVVQYTEILSIAWKWFGEKRVYVKGQDDFKGYKAGKINDYELVKLIRELYLEADIVIAHNGRTFDQRKCRARFAVHNIEPPSYPLELDTKLIAKQIGGFDANNLDELCKMLKLEYRKGDNGGIRTWDAIIEEGDPKAWKLMKEYNKGDIVTLEALYLRLRPYMKGHPNLNQMFEQYDSCPYCLSKALVHRDYYYSPQNTYYLYQCDNCGGWSKDPKAIKNSQKIQFARI